MAYDQSNPGGEEDAAPSSNVFHLAADMFPPGMAETLKKGEVIEFRVAETLDGDHEVGMEYNTGKDDTGGEETPPETEGEGGEGGEGGDWDKEAMAALSPQKDESEAY